MNIYTQEIASVLKIDIEEAAKVQNFIMEWFDGFRWSSASKAQIARVAREAQQMMTEQIFQVGA